jgi:hypothetical protein
MLNSRSLLILFALVLFWAALPLGVRAVDVYPEDREFWNAYKKAQELQDDKEIVRLVRRHKKSVIGVLDSLTTSLCQKEVPDDMADFRYLADVLSATSGNKRYVNRYEFLTGLSMEKRNDRLVANNNYYYGNVKYNEGKKQDNVYTLAEAKDFYAKSCAMLDEVEDYDLLAEVAARLAQCCLTMKDDYEACKAFKMSLDAIEQIDFPHPDRKWCKHEYERLTKAGYDPTKPRDEGGAPAVEDEEGGSEEDGGAAAEEPKSEFSFKEVGDKQVWPLKYAAMKKPDDYLTPTYYDGSQHFLWDQMHLQGVKQSTEMAQFKPVYCPINIYGEQVNVKRDKLKLTFNINSNKKTERVITIKEKPQALSFTTGKTGSAGKPLKYQMFVCCPGSQEVIFSLNTNLTPTENWMVVRSRVGCYMKGKVLGENFVFIDDNSSGIYGDSLPYAQDGITDGEYPYYTVDAIQKGKLKKAIPFSEIMSFGEKFYRVEANRTGIEFSTQEVAVDTGTVRLDWAGGGTKPRYVVIHSLDRAGVRCFFDVADGGKKGVVIPAGKYELGFGKISVGKKNKLQQIRIYRGKMKPFFVLKGEETVLEMGGPFTYEFDASTFGTKFIVKGKSINVFGRGGELYTMFWDLHPEVLVSMKVAGTKKIVVKKEPMPRPTLESWTASQPSVWHPNDFEYTNKKGADLKVRLETKKHKILGGPIEGDWE